MHGELDAETGIGSVVLEVELEFVGAGEPVGVDHDARRADNEQLAHHVRVDAQGARGDHRIGEVEGDPALSRAKRDARRHQPASLPYVLAAVLLDHKDVSECGRARQVGGKLGQLAEHGLKAHSPAGPQAPRQSAITAGHPQRVHHAVTILVQYPRPGRSSGMATTLTVSVPRKTLVGVGGFRRRRIGSAVVHPGSRRRANFNARPVRGDQVSDSPAGFRLSARIARSCAASTRASRIMASSSTCSCGAACFWWKLQKEKSSRHAEGLGHHLDQARLRVCTWPLRSFSRSECRRSARRWSSRSGQPPRCHLAAPVPAGCARSIAQPVHLVRQSAQNGRALCAIRCLAWRRSAPPLDRTTHHLISNGTSSCLVLKLTVLLPRDL